MKKIWICCIFITTLLWITGCGKGGAETGDIASTETELAEQAEDRETQGKDLGSGEAEAEGTDTDNAMTQEGAGEPDDKKAETQFPGETESVTEAQTADGELPCLMVSGTQLTDASGNSVQLKGISTHGLAWYPDYVNEACFRQLKEEWGMNVIRLAMYTAENGGYCTGGDKEQLKALVKAGVEYATDCDMYVIIDWHILSDGNPNIYLEEAKDFFREMSEAYGEYTNVLYEICNEPNGGVSWSEVKRYAEEIIPVIREKDGDGIILVGTPNWCQYVDQAAADPITGYDNIMYTLHFYAATHTDSLRAAMVSAVEEGLPVFVSEYGICDASGSGAIDVNQADKWVEAMDGLGISYVAWNLSNKAETSAVLKSSCGRTSGFAREDLSDSGRWLWDMLERAGAAGGSADSGAADADSGPGGNPAGIESGTDGNPGSSAGTGTAGTTEAGSLEVTAKIVNSWGQGSETCFQYELTFSNLTDTRQNGWTIRLAFSSDIILQDGWNGNYEADGNVLTISSLDYNGQIDAGGSVGNVGFIIQADEGCLMEGQMPEA